MKENILFNLGFMESQKKVILSTAYFPPIQYFSKFIQFDTIFLETQEHFSKQSYRNRCEILSPNGKQTLSIPVIKKSGIKQKIKEIEIDYSTDWQSIHRKSFEAAYLSSPFYEYYIDAFIPFYSKKVKFLFDLNLEIIQILLQQIQLTINLTFTDKYQKEYLFEDFRHSIHPKKKFQTKDDSFKLKQYTQVFSDKFQFTENLSIIDLLFNEGPNTENILKQSTII